MNAEDFESEELGIAKAVGLPLHGFDLVVGSFQRTGRDGIVVPGQDAVGV